VNIDFTKAVPEVFAVITSFSRPMSGTIPVRLIAAANRIPPAFLTRQDPGSRRRSNRLCPSCVTIDLTTVRRCQVVSGIETVCADQVARMARRFLS
jgi:hypothetical protein